MIEKVESVPRPHKRGQAVRAANFTRGFVCDLEHDFSPILIFADLNYLIIYMLMQNET